MTPNLNAIAQEARSAASEAEAASEGRGRCGKPATEALKRADELAEFLLRADLDDSEDIDALMNLARTYKNMRTQRETAM